MIRVTLMGAALVFAGLSSTAMAAEMSEGEYIATLGDCVACHTTDSAKPLAGGMAFPTPVGDVYSTNITPDKTYGIGNYTLEDFKKVMRKGVTKSGHNLYPAMPYTSYAKMTDEDLSALYNYLMTEVEPQAVANKDMDASWPFTMRWPLSIWNMVFHDSSVFQADPNKSEEWNRGAYLVQGPTHCGTCHTPRGAAMQEKGLTEKDRNFLSGSELAGWYAGDIRGNTYSEEELFALLKTGRSDRDSVLGPMAEMITHSSQYFTDEDIRSIVVYLTSLEAGNSAKPTKLAQTSEQAQTDYRMYCGTCHGREGQGREQVIPALAGNATVLANNPSSLINILLHGGKTATTQTHIGYDMPSYAWKFNDQQAADLLNHIRGSWGNQAGVVSAEQVKAQR